MNEKTIIDNVVSNEKSQNESSKKVENQSTQSNKVENPASFKKGKKDNATSKIIGASAAAAFLPLSPRGRHRDPLQADRHPAQGPGQG